MCFLFPTLLQLQRLHEQLSNSNSLKFCMPLASAILVSSDINMHFSHYLMFYDSIQFVPLSSMTLPTVTGQNGIGQNGRWTKWYGRSGMDKMVDGQNGIGQNGSGQNGTNKVVWTKW